MTVETQTVEAPRLSTKEKIVNALHEMGYTSRQVSVKKRHAGYSSAIDITVRDASVEFRKIEALESQFEKIDRCKSTGDILSGGNTFIDIRISKEVRETWQTKYLQKIEEAKALTSESHGYAIDERFTLHQIRGGRWYKVWDEQKSNWLESDWSSFEDLAVHLFTITQEPFRTETEKLIDAINEAKAKALEAKELKSEDGGTCNLDTPVIKLFKWKQEDVVSVAKATGVQIGEVMTGFWKGYRFIFTPMFGQANLRTRMAKAAEKVLRDRGYDVQLYQQAD